MGSQAMFEPTCFAEVERIFNKALACGEVQHEDEDGWDPAEAASGDNTKPLHHTGCGERDWRAKRFPGMALSDYLLQCRACGWQLFVSARSTDDLN